MSGHARLAAVDGGDRQAPQLEVDLVDSAGPADDVHAQAHALVVDVAVQEMAGAVGDVVHGHDGGGAECGGAGLLAQVLAGVFGDVGED